MKKSFITLFFLIKISTYSFSQIYNYDSKKLLSEVKKMVDEAKKSEGFILKQPGK